MAKSAKLAELVDTHERDFAGSWYDPDSGRLRISVATARGYDLLQSQGLTAAGVVTEDAERSLAEGLETLDRYLEESGLGGQAMMWGLTPDGNGYSIHVLDSVTEDQARQLDRELDGTIDLHVGYQQRFRASSALNDSSPYAGGGRYGLARPAPAPVLRPQIEGRCTGAFGWGLNGDDFIVTAGHCLPVDTPRSQVWRVSGSNDDLFLTAEELMSVFGGRTTWVEGAGTRTTGADGGNHGDLALFNVSAQGHASGNRIWVTNDVRQTVIGREAPVLDNLVCRSGTTSFERCGFRVTQVNARVTYDDGAVGRAMDVAYSGNRETCSSPGDSGGPVYRYSGTSVVAIGSISGNGSGNGECWLLFTGIEEAVQAWGGGPKT